MIIEKNYDSVQFDLANKNIIIDQIIFFNFIFTSDMMYEYTGNTQIMKEIMEGQNIREEHLDELLRDRLYLYIDNKDEYEILMDNGIRMLLKSSFSNFILESI
ncbi:hypothetical protein C923_02744 [Plasmodium falciparum UGT5.1]|uniref:Uncharacterized protein n=1 Tax=Plasmodium falciparum UGT5.1 TaxID=1237627 RepID=W7JCG4_PLAFA|nr:hypothetical protein C923_02744 [Plasmodium falciparum UGT5.1]